MQKFSKIRVAIYFLEYIHSYWHNFLNLLLLILTLALLWRSMLLSVDVDTRVSSIFDSKKVPFFLFLSLFLSSLSNWRVKVMK